MKSRSIWALLIAAALVLGSLGVPDATAFPRRGYVAPSVGRYYDSFDSYPLDPFYGYYSFVQPLPAYGILPLPLATQKMLYGPEPTQQGKPLRYHPLPPDKTPIEKRAELRRVRFEITVPFEKAIVKFDGVATKQTGLKRIFMTPAMEEDKQYTVTITAQWPTSDGTLSAPRTKTFTVVAGETVQHTFVE